MISLALFVILVAAFLTHARWLLVAAIAGHLIMFVVSARNLAVDRKARKVRKASRATSSGDPR